MISTLSELEEKIEILEKFQKSNNPFLKTIQLFMKRKKFTEMWVCLDINCDLYKPTYPLKKDWYSIP